MVPEGSVWAAWFDARAPERTLALRSTLPAAAIGRGEVSLGAASLGPSGCNGEVEAGGHSVRWRLSFGRGAAAEDAIPRWLLPVARLRGSGYLLPHPAMRVSGAVEIDGRILELVEAPAMEGHLWGRSRWPAWAWSRCAAFAEDPDASIDLLDVMGPGGVRLPLFTFRFRGAVHRFGEVPWIAMSRSVIASPAWHFAAQDATVAIDGVARAATERMVQVQYLEPDGSLRHCTHTALASMEVRVRARGFPGAPWRPQATLTAASGASLEFCGRDPDQRVLRLLVTAKAAPIQSTAESVAS